MAELAADGYPVTAHREYWHTINDLAHNLTDMIIKDHEETGQQYDRMILIPRGSYHPANIISRRLGFKANHLLHMCMTSYKDGEMQGSEKFIYGQMPNPEEVRGMDLLVIEEVCDTGRTMQHAKELLELAGAGVMKFGALHYKPGKSETGFVPDWFSVQTDEWIVYPWEKDERIGEISTVRRLSEDEKDALADITGQISAPVSN